MIQDPSKDVTLIVYNTPEPPRYLKVNKQLMRFILLVVPTLIILFLGGSFIYSIFLKNKVSELQSLQPAIKSKLIEQEKRYTAEIEDLKKTNASLTNKLSRGSSANESTSSLLSLFSVPLGAQDLRSQNLITLDEIRVETNGDKIQLNFNLTNNTPGNTKLSGYMTVVQYQGNLIQFYPDAELNEKNLRLEYANGEYYAFSRLRPSPVTFQKLSNLSSRYKIFLFSKTGDLVLYQQIGPYNIE